MEQTTAFVPGHISGFFQMHDNQKDPLRKGSRNCGFCISNGVKTQVKIDKNSSYDLEIYINGEKNRAETTETALEYILNGVKNKDFFIQINHQVQAPVGSGYGMSGAGTLGAVLSFSDVLNLELSRDEILTEAHRAEVTCKSGLGDVGPEMVGGIVVGTEPGAPPYGKLKKIKVDEKLDVFCGTLGSLSTSEVLNSSNFRKRSKELGEEALEDLLSDRSIENLMRVSKRFAIELGVFENEFVEILEEISSESPLGASAVLLGKAIFAPVPTSKSGVVEDLFLDYFDEKQIMKTSIDYKGARLE